MKRVMMVILALLMTTQVAFSIPQKTTRRQNKARRQTALQGVVIRNNRATLKPGYVFVTKSENLVALHSKDSDTEIDEATFRCKCKSKGRCGVVTQGQNLWCEGCGECSLEVTKITSKVTP